MTTYSISEAAERTGFSASALRYYERIGLATPTERTAAGYRRYDERALARLAFVARAKQLGCTLEEITDLVAVWDGERCEPVQQRLHELVTAKLADADRQVVDLVSFRRDLAAVAHALQQPTDGAAAACGDSCACLVEPETLTPVAIVCTLDAADRPGREQAWRNVAATAVAKERLDNGLGWRLHFGPPQHPAVDPAELAALVVAEQQCCTFFTFRLTVDARTVSLDVEVPTGASEIADALVG